MNVQYTNAILSAIKHVFDSMLDLEVTFENPVTKQVRYPTYDISCNIGLTGVMTGCIVLSFPKEIAKRIASAILRENIRTIDETLIDAICEVTNMVTGYADSDLQIEDLHYALPTVTIEKGMLLYPTNITIFSMPCIISHGKFEVDIALSVNRA